MKIGDEVRVPDDASKYGIHAGMMLAVVNTDVDYIHVECEDEHFFAIPRGEIDRPDPSEVVYVLTVADIETIAEQPITREDIERVRKAIDYSANEAVWDAVTAALTSSD